MIVKWTAMQIVVVAAVKSLKVVMSDRGTPRLNVGPQKTLQAATRT